MWFALDHAILHMPFFLTCGLCAPRTLVSEGKTTAEPVTSPVVVPKVKFLEQMVRLPCFSSLAHMVQLPGQCCSQPVCNSGRPSDCRRDHVLQHTRFPEEIHPCSPKTGNQAQTDEDLSTPPIISGCAQHSPCKFYATVRNYCHTPKVTILGKQHFSSL